MVKREFVDRKRVIDVVIDKGTNWKDILNLLNTSTEIPIYTEQEIIEPYLEKLKAEIGKSKTEHEMQIAERDIKAKLLISNIYCDIVNILDKCKAESEEENDREPEKAN